MTGTSLGHPCARAAPRRPGPLLTPRAPHAGRWCRAARTRSCWCWTCARLYCRPTRLPGCAWATARRSLRRQARARATRRAPRKRADGQGPVAAPRAWREGLARQRNTERLGAFKP